MPPAMRSDRKPPLALRSPIRLRSLCRPLQSSLPNLQTPSGNLTKFYLPKPSLEHELRPKYHMMSCELQALTKMVQDTLRGSTTTNQEGPNLFQRGKFYDEYSARRNERLKRKRGGVEQKTPSKQNLGVKIESAKRTGEVKKFETARKMATPLMERRQLATTQKRYSLRSSSCKKPPLAMSSRKGY